MRSISQYKNNSKYLSATNTDGTCTGRGKPHYIGGPGTYSSVPYDCDGWDTVNGYNSYMDPGQYQAGDVNCANSESCSRGVCCSGFVSRVWQLTRHYYTWELPNISTQLAWTAQLLRGDIMNKPYDHVVLFSSFGGDGIYDYESTTYNNYGRVRFDDETKPPEIALVDGLSYSQRSFECMPSGWQSAHSNANSNAAAKGNCNARRVTDCQPLLYSIRSNAAF